jgi:hypothetical protein
MKSSSVFPGGLLKSKPTWSITLMVFDHVGFFIVLISKKGAAFPQARHGPQECFMGLLLLIILILLLVGAFPSWGHSKGWGYGPSGLLGFVLIVVLVLVILDVVHLGSW